MTKQKIINLAKASTGMTHGGTSHKEFVKTYNSVKPLPRGYAVKLEDDWCDIFISVLFIKAGLSHLIGRECGVEHHKNIFKTLGIWLGLVRPQVGDIVTFHWGGLRNGFANHIGIVTDVKGDIITVTEGNTLINGKRGSGYKTYAWNDSVIQGYARPRYTGEEKQDMTIKKVEQHIIVKIPELRAFEQPNAIGKIVETIKKDYVKNIDQTTEYGGYLWGGWISSVDNKRRWTTIKKLDNSRVLTEIREGMIGHGGKTIQEYEKNQIGVKLGDVVSLKKDVKVTDFRYKVIGVANDKVELIVHSIRVDTNDVE